MRVIKRSITNLRVVFSSLVPLQTSCSNRLAVTYTFYLKQS
jgi:hypothetical protein